MAQKPGSTIQEILSKLIAPPQGIEPNRRDQKILEKEGKKELIYQKLATKKYRSHSLLPELEKEVKQKIAIAVENNLSIHITVPFGSYKLWRLPTSPNPDWSEVFNIIQLRNYLIPICVFYKPGVILEYFSDEIMVARMNNIPQQDLDSYTDSFLEIIEFVKKTLPENFTLKFSKIRDQISSEEYWKRIDEDMPNIKKLWNKLPKDEKEKRLTKAKRNYKGNLSKLTQAKREKVLLDSALCHDGFIFGNWDKGIPWAFNKQMIAAGFRYTGTWGIPLKSSKQSVTQFWVGIGVLEKRNQEYIPTILTFEQFNKVKLKLENYEVDIFSKQLKNLQIIAVFSNN